MKLAGPGHDRRVLLCQPSTTWAYPSPESPHHHKRIGGSRNAAVMNYKRNLLEKFVVGVSIKRENKSSERINTFWLFAGNVLGQRTVLE